MSTTKRYNANVENLVLSNLSTAPASDVGKLYQLNNTLFFESEPIGKLEIVNNKDLQVISIGIREFRHTCNTDLTLSNNPKNTIILTTVNNNIVVGLEISHPDGTDESNKVISEPAIITAISDDKKILTIDKEITQTLTGFTMVFKGKNTTGDNPTDPSISKSLLFKKHRIGLDSSNLERFEVLKYDDNIGDILFKGSKDTTQNITEPSYFNSARISCEIDGVAGDSDMPGRLTFFTSPDGSSTLKERMRITNSGTVVIGYEPLHSDGTNDSTSNYLSYDGDILNEATRKNIASIPGLYTGTEELTKNPNLLHIQDGNLVIRTNKSQTDNKNFSLLFERSADIKDGNVTDTPVSQNDILGSIQFRGAAKTQQTPLIKGEFKTGAEIRSMIDFSRNKQTSTNLSSAMPSNLEFYTSPRSSGIDYEAIKKRLIIDSRGFVGISSSETFNTDYVSSTSDLISELSVSGKIAITSIHNEGFPSNAPDTGAGAGWLYLKKDENQKVQLYNRNTAGDENCLSDIKELNDELFIKDKDNSALIARLDCSNLSETTAVNTTGTVTIHSNKTLTLSSINSINSINWLTDTTQLKNGDKILISNTVNNNRIFTVNLYSSQSGPITVSEQVNTEPSAGVFKINRISRKVNASSTSITISGNKTIASSLDYNFLLSEGDKIKVSSSAQDGNNRIFTVKTHSSVAGDITVDEDTILDSGNSSILIEKLDFNVQSLPDASGDIIVSNLKPENGQILYYNNGWKKTKGTDNQVLQVNGTVPVFKDLAFANLPSLGSLAASSGGTGISQYKKGDLLYANTGTDSSTLTSISSLDRLILGSNNTILKSNGTIPVWGKLEYADIDSTSIVETELATNSSATKLVSSLAAKEYTDSVANGLDIKDSCRVATTVGLTATYNNGTNGVGATLTNSGGFTVLSIDSISLSQDDRVLVKNQTDQKQNGIYKVTNTGSGSASWILTRTSDANTTANFTGGSYTFVEQGAVNANKSFVFTHIGQPTLGTTDLPVSLFSQTGIVSADAPIVITEGKLSLNTVPINKGGTNITTYTTGDILYSSATNVLSKLAIGGSGTVLSVSDTNVPFWTTSPVANAADANNISGNYSLNFSGSENFFITLSSNLILSSPITNGNKKGSSGTIVINTNGTNRTLSWANNVGWYFENSNALGLSLSDTIEIFNYFIAVDSTQDSARKILVTKAGNFGHYT